MNSNNTNIYAAARRSAGLTQEQAAELLDLSVESIKAYETGGRTPPDETVLRMSEVYGSPGLRLEHARTTDALGVIPEDARPVPFPLAVMGLYNYLLQFAEKHRGRQLLQIAADGVIDESERPLYNEIVCEIEGIAAAVLSLIWSDGGMKKERLDVGASKRSSGKSFSEPLDHVSILSKTPEMSRKIVGGPANSGTVRRHNPREDAGRKAVHLT